MVYFAESSDRIMHIINFMMLEYFENIGFCRSTVYKQFFCISINLERDSIFRNFKTLALVKV